MTTLGIPKYSFIVYYNDLRPMPLPNDMLEVIEVRPNVSLEEGQEPIGTLITCTTSEEFAWKDKYIELQRNLLDELKKRAYNGWTLKELIALERLEEFEDTLPWNKE